MKTPDRKYIPLCTAMRDTVGRGYSIQAFGHDLQAAIVVSLVALPLAMALAIAVGLPPQHGIYTAIAAGILTPLLGGSVMQVSGPTAAFVVIVAPIVVEHGLEGLILAEIMAGIMLLALAWMRLGRFISFVPYPVTTGFTAGIAVVLATLSMNDLLGLGLTSLPEAYGRKLLAIVEALPAARWAEAAIGGVSLLVMVTGKHLTRRVPSTVLGMLAGVGLGLAFQAAGIEYASIGSRFTYEMGGVTGRGIPPFPPALHDFSAWPRIDDIRLLLMPAVVIAALAALESLLSASVADGLSRRRHDPNAELAAIGIGNIASGLVAGIPATGAIARTTTNIKSGARTPLASCLHAALILLYVASLAPMISTIPMASLAALLVVTAYNMSHYRQFWRICRIAPRQDVVVLLTCFTLTVFVDMVAGVTVGIMLAALLFIQRISGVTEVQIEEAGAAPDTRVPPNVLVYHISGPLFFATVERALDRTAFLRRRIDTIVLDMQAVPLIDITGIVAVKELLTSDALSGKRVILCARPEMLAALLRKLTLSQITVATAPSVDEALAMAATASAS